MLFKDQINYKFELASVPKRIISLVPSQTELLHDLGLKNEVVGITKFCIHPKLWSNSKEKIGGTKNLNFSKIKNLQPDLIIANKEENIKEQIENLQKLYPVYTSDIPNLKQSLKMIKSIGELTDTVANSLIIIDKIKSEFDRLKTLENQNHSVLYLIWREPYMSVNQNTFINDMMNRCGLRNVIFAGKAYPIVTLIEISALKPDFIFLSSEPYPFKEKHIKELQKSCPTSKILLVNGEYFSWYGSRLKQAVNYFIGLMNKISYF